MNPKDLFFTEETTLSRADERFFARDKVIFNVTEDILVLMERHEISKKELARRLGKSKSFVTQVLSGARNMTLGTLSDICFELGVEPNVRVPLGENKAKHQVSANQGYNWQRSQSVDKRTDGVTKRDFQKIDNIIDRSERSHWTNVAA